MKRSAVPFVLCKLGPDLTDMQITTKFSFPSVFKCVELDIQNIYIILIGLDNISTAKQLAIHVKQWHRSLV